VIDFANQNQMHWESSLDYFWYLQTKSLCWYDQSGDL